MKKRSVLPRGTRKQLSRLSEGSVGPGLQFGSQKDWIKHLGGLSRVFKLKFNDVSRRFDKRDGYPSLFRRYQGRFAAFGKDD